MKATAYPCPCCGQQTKLKAKPAADITRELSQTERDTLSEADLKAYYARTSHIEDVAFFLRNAREDVLTDTLREQWLSLWSRAPRMQKRAVQAEYRILLTRYWLRIEERERAENPVPAPRYLGGLYPQRQPADADGTREAIWTFGYLDTHTGTVLTPDEWHRANRAADIAAAQVESDEAEVSAILRTFGVSPDLDVAHA